MLKSVSSITNAIGALNFKGTWDANANSRALNLKENHVSRKSNHR
jgi:hypothetical protein